MSTVTPLPTFSEPEPTLSTTGRITVPELEPYLEKPLKVLDHGFVRLIDYMGSDSSIVQAARVSYGKGTKRRNEDRGLIFYLMRHWHTTPFEMCEVKLHLKMPLFVARQWIRHRTASVNEYSARYSILSKEFYIPDMSQMAPQSSLNNQGRNSEDVLPKEQAEALLALLRRDSLQCYDTYMAHMNLSEEGEVQVPGQEGLSRELARMNLTLNYYTEMYWKIDLHNLFHFLRLRADSHAQWEIQVFAKAILEIVKAWVPLAFEAFEEYRLGAMSLSKTGRDVLKKLLRGEDVSQASSGLSKREWRDLATSLDFPAHLLKESASS